jgi:hypothetical protein
VELNGVELSFLLDTGVNTSVLLNLNAEDTLDLASEEKIKLRGLGGEEFIEAYRTSRNDLSIGKTRNKDFSLFIIYDEKVNFSPRLGVPVHGIIGYDFFKNFIVEINYSRKFLRVHDPKRFRKKLRGYREVPLSFFRNKPYVSSRLQVNGELENASLLVDNGLSDALWLLKNSMAIQVPDKSFDDFLGLGLLGDVVGKRSRINSIELGGYELKNITTAFPDSSSVKGLRLFEERNGSVGSELLRRFNFFFDYGNQKMYLWKNKYFREPFNYNMSGIVLEHNGFVVIESYASIPQEGDREEGQVFPMTSKPYKKFELQPAFRIVRIRKDSPAEIAGLHTGDILLEVNGKSAYNYSLEDLMRIFSSEDGRKIKLQVERDGQQLSYLFSLKKVL